MMTLGFFPLLVVLLFTTFLPSFGLNDLSTAPHPTPAAAAAATGFHSHLNFRWMLLPSMARSRNFPWVKLLLWCKRKRVLTTQTSVKEGRKEANPVQKEKGGGGGRKMANFPKFSLYRKYPSFLKV